MWNSRWATHWPDERNGWVARCWRADRRDSDATECVLSGPSSRPASASRSEASPWEVPCILSLQHCVRDGSCSSMMISFWNGCSFWIYYNGIFLKSIFRCRFGVCLERFGSPEVKQAADKYVNNMFKTHNVIVSRVIARQAGLRRGFHNQAKLRKKCVKNKWEGFFKAFHKMLFQKKLEKYQENARK